MDIRLQQLYDAASSLFIRQGYARTQVSDIARQAGISVGAVYSLFTGKRTIFQFLLKCTIAPEFLDGELTLPLDAEVFVGLDAELEEVFAANAADYRRPLEKGGLYTYSEMLSSAFDLVSRYGIGVLLVEKNTKEFPQLAASYAGHRRHFFDTTAAYLDKFIAEGQVRTVPDAGLATRVIVETLAYWGMHIRHDVYQPDKALPIDTAKQVCLDALLHAYQA